MAASATTATVPWVTSLASLARLRVLAPVAAAWLLSACTGAPSPGPDAPSTQPSPAPVVRTSPLSGTFGLAPDSLPARDLTLLAAGGRVVVGGSEAQTYGADGSRSWRAPLPGRVVAAVASADGSAVVVLSSSDADRRSTLTFLDAATGRGARRVAFAEVADAGIAAAGDVVVVTADHLQGRPSQAAGYTSSGHRLWERAVPPRTVRAQAAGGRVLLSTLPSFAPDDTPSAPGSVHVLDPGTGRTVAHVPAGVALFDHPVVVEGDRWWLDGEDGLWREHDAEGQRTGRSARGELTGTGIRVYRWDTGWRTGSAAAARVGASADLIADSATLSLWADPTQPYPRVATRPGTGRVAAYVAAPAGQQVGGDAVLRPGSVTSLVCPGAVPASKCTVTTWRLPR